MDTGNTTNTTNNPILPIIQSGMGTICKEVEAGGLWFEQAAVKDVSGQETELPKEVAAVGVKIQPTTVQIPQPVAQMGVKAVGDAIRPEEPAVVLPLTDEQIALGLKQSITSSWRWLAEFCVRKLKQLHAKIRKN